MTFNTSKSMIITFNSEFRDWYPLKICDKENNTIQYNNEYLFDGAKSITINNININHYIINYNRNYPILRSNDWFNASITVNNATFVNITSFIENPLFYTKSSIHIINGFVININVSNIIFYASHSTQPDYATRVIIFEANVFQNVSAQNMFDSTWSYDDVKIPFRNVCI